MSIQTLSDINLLGVKQASPVQLQTVEVEVSVDRIMEGYSKAFIHEANRVNFGLLDRSGLTADELTAYSAYLLTQRVKYVHQDCPQWRKLSNLWMPAFIQLAISLIGEVVIHEDGLRFIPIMREESAMTYEEAEAISNKLYNFYGVLQVLKNAFPRSIEGDKDVMTCVLINDYVRGYSKVTLVQSSYVAAFLNMRLKEEMKFADLFRQEYDHIDTIANAIVSEPSLF